MPRYTLPKEIADLHKAFGRKKLQGEVGFIYQQIQLSPYWDRTCEKAKTVYGLSPRQLGIQVALAFLLTPRCKSDRPLHHFHVDFSISWSRSVQYQIDASFWPRVEGWN